MTDEHGMSNRANQKIASYYKGDKGAEYALGRHQDDLNHLGYRLQSRFYLPYLCEDMRVLDFGCGNGSMAKVIGPYVKSIEGLEVNELPHRLAQDSQGLTIYAGLDEIPTEIRYEAIISNHVFEHIPCVIDVLRSLSELLVPGGRIITVLPIEDFRTSENKEWEGEDINLHLHTWTPRLFANTLSEAGFIPRDLRIVTSAWSPKMFFLGDNTLQSVFGRLFAILRRRRQLFAYAEKQE